MEEEINKLEIKLKNGRTLKLKLVDINKKIPSFCAQTIPSLTDELLVELYLTRNESLHITKKGLFKESNYIIPRDSIVYIKY